MKNVFFAGPYTPTEWVAAHGFRPWRLQGKSPLKPHSCMAAAECCPWAAACLREVADTPEGACLILTTNCDQMRRSVEEAESLCGLPVFLLNAPSTWERLSSLRLYQSELRRLSRFLVGLGGVAPSNQTLASAMSAYDGARKEILQSASLLSARQLAERLLALDRSAPGEINQIQAIKPVRESAKAPRIALIGGPLAAEAWSLYDLIEQGGARIVLNGLEGGERTVPGRFDKKKMIEDAFGEMSEVWFYSIPHVSQRPNSRLYIWVEEMMTRRRTEGVVFWSQVWCDLWSAEAARFKEWRPMPFVHLKADVAGPIDAHILSRLQAFLETLS